MKLNFCKFLIFSLVFTLAKSHTIQSRLTNEKLKSFNDKTDARNVKRNVRNEKEFLEERSAGSGRLSWRECNLENELKQDCGFYGMNEEECYKRECCWSETKTTGVPWCYHSKPTISQKCNMHSDERVECGFYGVRKEQCLAQGCCWQPINENGIPWCFQYKTVETQPGECGVPAISPSVAGRIVGGKAARPHSWPWQVSLQAGSHFCGGSVINNEWIVTAAHCKPGFSWGSGEKEVVVGMHSMSGEAVSKQTIRVEEVLAHEDYDDMAYDQDIMLLKLAESIEFSDQVSPVCLPAQNEEFEAGTKCYTTGWGNLEAGGSSPDELQQVMVPLIRREVCNQEDWYEGKISENMVCAGYAEGGRDSCQGDSGGPLVCFHDEKWKLAGIVSWGYGCASERKPGVYAKTSNYVDWIANQITEYSKRHK